MDMFADKSCLWSTHYKYLHQVLLLNDNDIVQLSLSFSLLLVFSPDMLTEVDNLQGIYPLKDECVFGCSLEPRLADQTKPQQLKWLWLKDSMNSTINQRLVEQTQDVNFKL